MLKNADIKYIEERRHRRYIISDPPEAEMNRYFRELFEYPVKGKQISTPVKAYIVSCIKKNEERIAGLVCSYNNQYLVIFPELKLNSALKITHNESENKLLEAFFCNATNAAKNAFYSVALEIVKEKQRQRIQKDLDIEGVIYSNYPEPDEFIGDGFVWFNMNVLEAEQRASNAVAAIASAMNNDNISYKTIASVLPEDYASKFMMRDFDDFELAQIGALKDIEV